MNLEELKQTIEKQTGVPAYLLTGETAEENIARAKALLAYRKDAEAKRPKTVAEEFSAWMNAREGNEQPDTAGQALANIEKAAGVNTGGYPILRDCGEVITGSQQSPRDAFNEFASKKFAFNPFRSDDGWTHIT